MSKRWAAKSLPPGKAQRLFLNGKPIVQCFNLSTFAEQMLLHENAVVKIEADIPLDRAALVGCGVITGAGAVINPRKGTAALMLPRHETPTRPVDERHDCQDIGPAYVPGTVWGTASSQTAKFRSRRRACLLIPANYHAPLGSAVSPRPITRTTTSTAEKASFSSESPARLTPLCPPRANAGKQTRPASRAG